MASLWTNIPIDMENPDFLYGALEEVTSSRIVIVAGDVTATYHGSFTFDSQGYVYGQMRAYTVEENGIELAEITGINRDAYTTVNLIDGGDATALYRYVFSGADRLQGSADRDILDGYAGADRIEGNGGGDRILGGDGKDRVWGGSGADRIFGENQNDRLLGQGGRDGLAGGAGADVLSGGAGNDSLDGGTGADRLIGGAGRDALRGGDMHTRDVFVFQKTGDSKVGKAHDTIHDFLTGVDDIHLAAIDANSAKGGDQAFGFSGTTAKAHAVWTVDKGGDLLLRGDVNGDTRADFEILVADTDSLSFRDFIL